MFKIYSKTISILTLAALLSCNHQPSDIRQEVLPGSTPLQSQLSSEVSVQPAEFKSFEEKIILNGNITAHNKVDLKFERGGLLQSFDLRNGDFVSEGTIIAQLDQQELDHKEKLLLAELQIAQLDINERILLSGGEFGIDSTVSEEQINYIRIKSGIHKYERQIEELQFQKSKMIVTAPFNGVVADVKVRQHQVVSPGEVICTLIEHNSIEAEFDLLETSLDEVSRGQKINISPMSLPDLKLTGYVSRINPLVDENGLINIRARISGSTRKLFDGMKVKIEVLQQSEPMVVIPKEALVLISNRQVVFTYDTTKQLAQWKYVTVAHENDTEIAISEGLGKNDQIIVKGNLNLDHDAKVVLINEGYVRD